MILENVENVKTLDRCLDVSKQLYDRNATSISRDTISVILLFLF
jgi:hypothetical protein